MNQTSNILIVLMDQLRNDVACHEKYPFVETPHIDRFREEAIGFDNAFCQYPVCVPSRASLITGRYPHQIGIVNNRCNLSADTPTMAEAFAAAGYAVPAFGKTHPHKGFEKYPEAKGIEGYGTADYGMAAPSDRIVGIFNGALENQHDRAAVRQFETFLEQKTPEKPFLAFLGIMAPHPPLYPPREFRGRYRPEDISLPEVDPDEWKSKPDCQRRNSIRIWLSRDEAARRAIIAAYFDMVTYADHCFGVALQTLEDAGASENTIVILLSDHGEMLGEHNMIGKMNSLYDAVLRFPLFLRSPHLPRGSRRSQLVEMIDIAPTLFEFTGITPIPSLPGRSLVPLFTSPNRAHRSEIYSMTNNARLVRNERWKLVLYSDGGGEFYDLATDPGEHRNLFQDEAASEPRRLLESLLLQHLVTHGPCPANPGPDDH